MPLVTLAILPERFTQFAPASIVSHTPVELATNACRQSFGSSVMSWMLAPGNGVAVASAVPPAVVRTNTAPPMPM
jgi:hypothetical protein